MLLMKSLKMLPILCLVTVAAVEANSTFVTYSGSTFEAVTDYPKLGESWRDPGRLIWGGKSVQRPSRTIMRGGQRYTYTYPSSYFYGTAEEASAHCASLGNGARLPTKNEYIQLAKFQGSDSAVGYEPDSYLSIQESFWSSSSRTIAGVQARYFFDGFSGTVEVDDRPMKYARCVIRENYRE